MAEYLGFATHLVYLGPLFEEVLQADTQRPQGTAFSRSGRQSEVRNIVTGVAGLVIFAVFPVAPPRLTDLPLLDTITVHAKGYRSVLPPSLVNEYAAMPSFHAGWNLLLGVMLFRASHNVAVRAFAVEQAQQMRAVAAGAGEADADALRHAVDARGRHVPTANLKTLFAVEGGKILGAGNGDPNSHEPEQFECGAGKRSLFNGLAQFIVRAGSGRGRIEVRATAEGLKPAVLTIDRADVAPRPQVPPTPPVAMQVRDWRRSALFPERPDPNLAPADGDNNSWDLIRSGQPTPAEPRPGWRVYRTQVTPWKRIAAEGGVITFDAVAGRAELWIDEARIAVKDSPAAGPLTTRMAPGGGPRVIVLLVEAPAGQPSGILGPVKIAAR